MVDLATDPYTLHAQYGNSEKLRIRQEAHRLYSERSDDFMAWLLGFLDPQAGDRIADVGSGQGAYHPYLAGFGASIIALDLSYGMVQEAQMQAKQARLPVTAVQADAQYLPLAENSCDRIMANYMIYHVPDQAMALAEMARVLKPGGRIIMATNSADTYQRLYDLHDEAVKELGYTRDSGSFASGFTLAHLDRIQQVFPNARVEERRDAFLFPTVEAALRYYASGYIDLIAESPPDHSHRVRLLPVMADKIQRVIEREGVFRVPKGSGCFVAEKVES